MGIIKLRKMVDNMDFKLEELSNDELLDIYQMQVNFIEYLEDLKEKAQDEGDE